MLESSYKSHLKVVAECELHTVLVYTASRILYGFSCTGSRFLCWLVSGRGSCRGAALGDGENVNTLSLSRPSMCARESSYSVELAPGERLLLGVGLSVRLCSIAREALPTNRSGEERGD